MPRIVDEPVDFSRLTAKQVNTLPNETFRYVMQEVLKLAQDDRRENNLLYYAPAHDACWQIHESNADVVGAGGGNGSSKTESVIAHIMMLATGVIPDEPRIRKAMLPKFRGPVNCRVIVESLTTTLHNVILPKLQWWKWTGLHPQGGDQGHWGWIPKTSLRRGAWEKSWSEKLRTLTVLCRDPEDPDKVMGESTIQFMSHDQDASDFASGDFHHVMFDEPSSNAIWTENQARTMRVDGKMYLAMTWPDDPSIPVDWIFDEVYEKGREGPNKSPHVDWFELDTRNNPHISQQAVSKKMEGWSHEMRTVRIAGQPIRFSNRIHPLFTDLSSWWCFVCGRLILPVEGKCDCGSSDICEFNHVEDFEVARNWPAIFVLDPHPRKPHMFLWALVDPADDIWVIQDGESTDDLAEMRADIEDMEESLGINTQVRLMDPNMGRSPASSRREITWQDEFDRAGLMCDLADDSDVGGGRFNEYLKPDPHTLRPRIHFHPRCQSSIYQTKRYVWDDHRRKQEKDLKQKARQKYDDYPTMIKYLLNFEPTFQFLHRGAPIITRTGTRQGAY